MEAALLGGLIKVILPKLFSLLDEKYKLRKSMKKDIEFLRKELRMIVGAIDDELFAQREDHGAIPRLAVEDLRDLAHRIEDCMESLMYQATRHQNASSIRRGVQSLKKLYSDDHAKEMQRLRVMAVEANERKQRYTVPGPASSAIQMDDSSSSASDPRYLSDNLVGLEDPRAKLLWQLAEAPEGQPKKLKVISIVGFRGMGKTALAADVYNRERHRFEKCAWVCAALKDPSAILNEILVAITSDARSCQDTSEAHLCGVLRQQLVKKRFLLVIDDVRTEDQWNSIESAFPANEGINSRIVVTTTVQAVANLCSFGDGYVHKIKKLDEYWSKELLFSKACPEKYSTYQQPDPAEILKKCDGQPLALVTVGEFLKSKQWPIGPDCEKLCSQISLLLEKEPKFQNLRRVLMGSYASLPGHALKACLLYFAMFPGDHPIRKKSLFRRWLAEGFIGTQPSSGALDAAAAEFDMLMDRNLIESIDVSNNDSVRSCQIYSIMREFILQMSISQNFVTLLCADKKEHKYVRRLSLHNTATDGDCLNNVVLSLVRSLTIFGEAGETLLDFSKYSLLRVLDLEKCDDLKDDHLKHIGNLLLLRYLSLGGNVTGLPRDIAKLKHLETLDFRSLGGNLLLLPVEVFLLPCLIHILGKFKLEAKPKTEVQEFLSKQKIVLESLAGFVTDGSEGFLHFMSHMNKLRKVKIWCEQSSAERTDLLEAIQQFIHDDKQQSNKGARSLSLNFDGCSGEFLNSLHGPCYLSSLKLYGNLSVLPQFVVSLCNSLSELCLSSTKLTRGVLEALSNLRNLKYLKLIAYDLETFIIKVHTLPNLVRLSMELQCPTFPIIEQGALPFLVALQLLCKDLNGLSDIQIEGHKNLEEVILDPRVTTETKGKWEKAAKEHPNMPKLMFLKSTKMAHHQISESSSVPKKQKLNDSVVQSRPKNQKLLNNCVFQSRPEKQKLQNNSVVQSRSKKQKLANNSVVQSSSDDQINSAFDDMKLSEGSAVTVLSIAVNGTTTSDAH